MDSAGRWLLTGTPVSFFSCDPSAAVSKTTHMKAAIAEEARNRLCPERAEFFLLVIVLISGLRQQEYCFPALRSPGRGAMVFGTCSLHTEGTTPGCKGVG